jgi:hypothetical protein
MRSHRKIRLIHSPAIPRAAVLACVALFGIGAFVPPAAAAPQKLGPFPLPVRINKVSLPLTANSIIDVNSSRGNFNAKGDVIVSAPAATLTNAAVEIGKTLLPYDVPNDDCTIRVHRIVDLQIFSQSYEVRAKGTILVSLLDCSFRVKAVTWNRDERNVEFEFAFQPVASPKKLELKLMRTPTITLPTSWWGIKNFGKVEEKIQKQLQNAFSQTPLFTVPAPYGARIAIQGASVSGGDGTMSFLLRGDAHIDERNTTQLIAYLLAQQMEDVFYFTISLEAPPTN